MFHIVLIHACNMRRMHWHHALHMHGRIASSRVWVHGMVYLPVLEMGRELGEKMGQSPR